MIIGIDSSRAFVTHKTGTENYSYYLIREILRLPESRKHAFVLFIRPNTIVPQELVGYSNVIVKVVKWKYLWTQVGLAWETWQKPTLDVLWVPAHTLPVIRNPKLKTVVTIHGLEYQWLPEYKNILQKWYLPLSTFYAAASADRLIAVSNFTQNQLLKELHTSPKKIKVIHEGVEIQEIHDQNVSKLDHLALMDRYGIQDKKYLLFVGTVQPRKNLVSLVEAFSLFAKDNPEYRLVIAGGIGWMAGEILSAPDRYMISDKVIFTGRISDAVMRELYKGALIYVQPSITEGFGLPILEAMHLSVPVISSDGGALSEVVGKAGLLISLNENFVVKLAVAMKRVKDDQKLQKSLISMGLKRVEEFGWDRAAKTTLEWITG